MHTGNEDWDTRKMFSHYHKITQHSSVAGRVRRCKQSHVFICFMQLLDSDEKSWDGSVKIFPLLVVVSKNKFMLSHKMNPIKFFFTEKHILSDDKGVSDILFHFHSFSSQFFHTRRCHRRLIAIFVHHTTHNDDEFSSFSFLLLLLLSFSFLFHLLIDSRRLRCHRRSFARHE